MNAMKLFNTAWEAVETIRQGAHPDRHNLSGREARAIARGEVADLILIMDEGDVAVPGSVFDGCEGNRCYTSDDGRYIVRRRWQGTDVIFDVIDTVAHRIGRSDW